MPQIPSPLSHNVSASSSCDHSVLISYPADQEVENLTVICVRFYEGVLQHKGSRDATFKIKPSRETKPRQNLISYINNVLTSSLVGELLTFEVNAQISGQKN